MLQNLLFLAYMAGILCGIDTIHFDSRFRAAFWEQAQQQELKIHHVAERVLWRFQW